MELVLNGAEVFRAYATLGANPILGQIFESCSRCHTVIRITNFRIIDPTTHVAYILFHNLFV